MRCTVWIAAASTLAAFAACGGHLGSGHAPSLQLPARAEPWQIAIDVEGDESSDLDQAVEWIVHDATRVRRVKSGEEIRLRLRGNQSRGVGSCTWKLDVSAVAAGAPLFKDTKEYNKSGIWSNVKAECEKMMSSSVVWAIERSLDAAAKGAPVTATAPASDTPSPAKPLAIAKELEPRRGKTQNPRAVAIVIGVEHYRRDVVDAKGAAGDAKLFADVLEKTIGVPRANIHLLVDADATRSSIEAELFEWLPRNASPDAPAFVYFAGHGSPDPQTGTRYLLPWDGDPKFVSTQGIPVDDLYAKLDKLHTRHTLAFLDACFSGSGGRSVLAPGARPLVREKAPVKAPSSRLAVFAAAGPNEITSVAPSGNGLFSYFLLRGLNGEADSDHDGMVTFGELTFFTSAHVADEARRQNRDQRPLVVGGGAATSSITLTRIENR